ncbi:MAG: hypothetical protein HY720_13995 [Planctomycetes bacterium]|nr:hypothetical protein [Planctomycetota bacterium]
MVVPGLADAHCHALYIGGLRGVMADLYSASNLEEMSAAIQFGPFDYYGGEEVGEATEKRILDGMETTLVEARKAGVTPVHDIHVPRRFLSFVLRFRDKEAGTKESNDHFRLGESVKLYIDGVFSNHTALVAEPYLDGAKDRSVTRITHHRPARPGAR